jgi:hypothetical protein
MKSPRKNNLCKSLREVYSFGQNKQWLVIAGFFCSAVTGCLFPAMAFVFATSFEEMTASTSGQDFLADIQCVSFVLMVLG